MSVHTQPQDQRFVPISARVMATVSGSTGAAFGIGSKSAIVMLTILALVSTIHLLATFRRPVRWHSFCSPALGAIVLLSAYATLSAFWAINSIAAVSAGALLLLTALMAFLVASCFDELADAVVVLNAGWFVIGFTAGTLFLLFEISTNYAFTRYFFNTFPFLSPNSTSMFRMQDGFVVRIGRSFANWNVAGVNMLFWPVVLMTLSLWKGTTGKIMVGSISILLLAATLNSEHQTSMLAIAIGACVLILSWRFSRVVQGLTIACLALACLATVPLGQIAHDELELQRNNWVPHSLQGRIVVWHTTAQQVYDRPVTGIGANNTADLTAITPKAEKIPGDPLAPTLSTHAHNNYLQAWLELGAIGVSLIFAIGYLTISRISGLSHQIVPYAYATAWVGLVQSFATWNMWHSWYQATFLLAFAVLCLARRLSEVTARGEDGVAFSDVWLPSWLNSLDRGHRPKTSPGARERG